MKIKLNEPQRKECIRYIKDCYNRMNIELQQKLNLPYIEDIIQLKKDFYKTEKLHELYIKLQIFDEFEFDEKEMDCENFIFGVLCLAMLGFSSNP